MLKFFRKKEHFIAMSKADNAIAMVDDITNRMRSYSAGPDPIKGLMSDLWQHRNNIPFVTTVYEAIQEVKPSE